MLALGGAEAYYLVTLEDDGAIDYSLFLQRFAIRLKGNPHPHPHPNPKSHPHPHPHPNQARTAPGNAPCCAPCTTRYSRPTCRQLW